MFSNKKYNQVQMEFDFLRPQEDDRNYVYGGRSFYFFDLDDNVAFLDTPIVIFEKETNKELFLGSGEYAKNSKLIGKSGDYSNYYVNYDDSVGTFRFFSDQKQNLWERLCRKKQPLVRDILATLKKPDVLWKGPSWSFFYHAVYNNRPISLITARGHELETMKEGIATLLKAVGLNRKPNYLSIYPVSNPRIKEELSAGNRGMRIPELKKRAIRESFNEAIKVYGNSPYHRFGMSDDDPHNIELITQEFSELKKEYPEMSFFIIYAKEDTYVKTEIMSDGRTNQSYLSVDSKGSQLSLF